MVKREEECIEDNYDDDCIPTVSQQTIMSDNDDEDDHWSPTQFYAFVFLSNELKKHFVNSAITAIKPLGFISMSFPLNDPSLFSVYSSSHLNFVGIRQIKCQQ